jgi:PelA/Pel-15E family pectate lyase
MRNQRTVGMLALALTVCLASSGMAQGQTENTDAMARRAQQALDKAIRFLRTEVATEGGYLWRYSEDLSLREGERKASSTTAWVQPPGTPTVGLAFVAAYEATHSEEARTAMLDAANCLIRGQYRSGGWGPSIEFDPNLRSKYAYRMDPASRGAANVSSLDDNTTQSAVDFLMNADRALGFKNTGIHEAATYALRHLMDAQYAIGGWPQKFEGPADREFATTKTAVIPNGPVTPWVRHIGSMRNYTFNDHGMDRMVELFLSAADIYNRPEYQAVAEKTGDFILQAQLPDPQPGWAQQYDMEMRPTWARRFEPPSVATSETQELLGTLALLYEKTGKDKYLRPIPKTLAWLRRSQLPDGRFPRYIEFETNKPLYVDSRGELTHSSADLYGHYGWQVGSSLDQLQKRYDRLDKQGPPRVEAAPRKPGFVPNGITASAKKALETIDDRGRWVENGNLRAQDQGRAATRVIMMLTASKNIEALAGFLSYANPQ